MTSRVEVPPMIGNRYLSLGMDEVRRDLCQWSQYEAMCQNIAPRQSQRRLPIDQITIKQ